MGKRVLKFIPNTPALVAWGQKPTTHHLSNLINGRTEGNILNSQALLRHMNKFSAYMITNASLLKNYIFGAFTRYKAGTLQDALITHLGLAILPARRWFVRHKLLSVHLAPVHFSTARALQAPSM